jgi:CSLREA domain-containing protein
MNAQVERETSLSIARRAWHRAVFFVAPAALPVFLSVSAGSASAANITVNTLEDAADSDGDCSLREAITAANQNFPRDGCPAGSSLAADTIDFSVTGTITLASTLPSIFSSMIIAGPGADKLTISGNNAVRVMWVFPGYSLTVQDLTIANGNADYGAGIRNSGQLTVIRTTFSDNHVSGEGGGIASFTSATLAVTDSAFSGNSANDSGAAISSTGLVTVQNSAFTDNSALYYGGAIFTRDGTLVDSSFMNNTARIGGGGISAFGVLTVTNSTFFNNTATQAPFGLGGAIFSGGGAGGAVNITNSTFSGNTASSTGGAIRHQDGPLTATNCTFTGNGAQIAGGAMSHYPGRATVTLRNTIVANSPSGGNCGGAVDDGGGNLTYPDASCPGLNADPVLGPLANNGGPTLTHALGAGSAAIDLGDDSNCPATDQRGVARPYGVHCDIGAYEIENQPPVANAGPDQDVSAGPACWADVTLHGEGSDPDGDTLTYTWSGSSFTASGATPMVDLPLGVHPITLTVSDGKGGSASDEVEVTVADTTPPAIESLTAAPDLLWPPNHTMVPVSISVSASDQCGDATCRIVSVASNEPDSDPGDDWEITGALALDLRAERLGSGSGRVYTITVWCGDASDNGSTSTVTVTVPKSQSSN